MGRINIFHPDDTERLRAYIGDELFMRQKANQRACMFIKNQACFLAFTYYAPADIKGRGERISLFCSREELAVFCSAAAPLAAATSLSADKPPFTALLDFFHDLTAGDMDTLDQMEGQIQAFEDGLIMTRKPLGAAYTHIIALRRSVHKIKHCYEQMAFIIDFCVENESGAIPKDLLPRFSALSRRLHFLVDTALHLSECVNQAREAYQSKVDMEQNQIMKILTIVTAVFSPLSLLVGWYGMNLQMPEYKWPWGYLYVILLSGAVCGLCIYIIKRRKWF